MAEDKKGFILYADLIYTVEKMPKEKAGELFLHILKYVNDQNPVTDDLIIELTFEPVKQQLKRDLKKYDDKRERNKDIAIAGWQKRKDANACEHIETHAKNADKDNVIVNDNVKVKDKVINKELSLPFSSDLFLNKWNILKSEPKWRKKSHSALQESLDELKKYDEKTAILMMQKSIAGGWQGLFEIKTQQNGNEKLSTDRNSHLIPL